MTTDPYPNTPAPHGPAHVAVGDHQVANVATRSRRARSGRACGTPAVDPGRSADVIPSRGIEPITKYPYARQRAGRLGHRAAAAGRARHATAADRTNTPPRLGDGPARHHRPRAAAQQQFSPSSTGLRRRLRRASPATPAGGPGAMRRAPRSSPSRRAGRVSANARPAVRRAHRAARLRPVRRGRTACSRGRTTTSRKPDARPPAGAGAGAMMPRNVAGRPDGPERVQPRPTASAPARRSSLKVPGPRHARRPSRRRARCRSPTSRAPTTARRRSW